MSYFKLERDNFPLLGSPDGKVVGAAVATRLRSIFFKVVTTDNIYRMSVCLLIH